MCERESGGGRQLAASDHFGGDGRVKVECTAKRAEAMCPRSSETRCLLGTPRAAVGANLPKVTGSAQRALNAQAVRVSQLRAVWTGDGEPRP